MRSKSVLRLFNIFLCLCIMFTVSFGSTAVVNAAPGSTTVLAKDIKGNPSESQISYFIKKGILTAFSDKTFKPNQNIKRIEFITAVNKLFGFTKTSVISFKDVPASNANYKEVSKAIAAGYISGFSDKTFKLNNSITRQEAAQIICNLLGYSASKDSNVLNKIKDLNFTPSTYLTYISTAIKNGYLSLYPGNLFKPSKTLTRADTALLLSKISKTVFNKAGAYSDADGSKTVNGNVIVNTPNVILKNLAINGNLYLTEGIGEGNSSLINVTVKGKTYINGGGSNSIAIQDSTLGDTVVNKKNSPVRLAASGSTTIGNLTVNSSCRLEESSLSGKGFGNVTVNLSTPSAKPVEFLGSFDNVTLNSKTTEVDLLNGNITNFSSGQGASGATLRIDLPASIKNVILNASADVKGSGSVNTVDVRAAGVTVEQKPAYATVKSGLRAIINGMLVSDSFSFQPTLTSAVINLSTGKLTLTGKNLVSVSGTKNDINAAKLTISTGVLGRSIKFTASSNADITSSTSAVLQLTDADMTTIKSIMTGSSATYKITAAMGWNGSTSPPDYDNNPVTISGNFNPVLTSATLDLTTGKLVISGSYFASVTGSNNDIDASKLTITDGNGGHSRILSSTPSVEKTSSTSASLTLSSTDLTAIKIWALQNGISVNGQAYNIAATAGWNGTNSLADLTGNAVTVKGNALPVITSASYNVTSGQLVINGTNLISLSGSANDIIASKFTLSDGAGGHSRTLSTSSNVDITSASSATITVSGTDLTSIASWAIQGGTTINGYYYNLAAAAGWNGPDSPADMTGNIITVSSNGRPEIATASLDLTNGYLVIYGYNLTSISGSNNDILSPAFIINDGSGGHSTSLSSTSYVDIASSTSATIVLSANDLAAVKSWAVQNGSTINGYTYYLNALSGWNGSNSAQDMNNPLTVSGNNAPSISSATLNVVTGQLVLYGSNFNYISGNYDIFPSYLTIHDSSGVHSETLSLTTPIDLSSTTSASLSLNATNLYNIKRWATQDGTTMNGYYYYLSASSGWNGSNSSTDYNNTLTVMGNASPTITSATYNASNGQLVLSGSNFNSFSGSANDILSSHFTISDGTVGHSFTLTGQTSNAEISSSTSATITVAGTDLTGLNWLTQNGTSLNGHSYNLSVSADWNGTGTLADTTNPLTVTGNSVPALQSASRTSSTQIIVTLSKLVNASTITKNNDGGFTVFDTSNSAITFAVSAINPGTGNDKVVLTVADTGSAANLTVKYTASGNGTVADASGNPMASNATGIAVTNTATAPALSSVTLNAYSGAATSSLTIVFTGNVDDSTISASDFTLGGTGINGAHISSIDFGTANDNSMILILDKLLTLTKDQTITVTPGIGSFRGMNGAANTSNATVTYTSP